MQAGRAAQPLRPSCSIEHLGTACIGLHHAPPTFSKPLLTPDRGHWDGSAIYKSTLAFDSKTDVITVWYSALAGDSWHLGVTQGDLRHTLQELRVPDRRPF